MGNGCHHAFAVAQQFFGELLFLKQGKGHANDSPLFGEWRNGNGGFFQHAAANAFGKSAFGILLKIALAGPLVKQPGEVPGQDIGPCEANDKKCGAATALRLGCENPLPTSTA